jgi:WD40 repeat protein
MAEIEVDMADDRESPENPNLANDEELIKKVSKPLVARDWNTGSIEQTMKEILYQEIAPTRPLFKMQFIKKRREFARPYKFGDKDPNDNVIEIRQQHDTFATFVKKQTLEMGLQGCNPMRDLATQTPWNRKMNNATQTVYEDLQIQVEDDDKGVLSLMRNFEVMNEMESALQQNEMIDIFQDDFAVLPHDEFSSDEVGKLTSEISELKRTTYHSCIGKKIFCIRSMPPLSVNDSGPKLVCVGYIDHFTFDDRIELFTKSMKYTLLLWNIEDVSEILPALEVTSHLEITTFEFHPEKPNILIGGTANGRIVRWDLQEGMNQTDVWNKKGKNTKQEVQTLPVVKPKLVSALQDAASGTGNKIDEAKSKNVPSHKSKIVDIKWVSHEWEVEKRALHYTTASKSKETSQFVSLSEDGQILIWDIRIPGDKELEEYSWKAMFSIQLVRPEGAGIMGGSNLIFDNKKGLTRPILYGVSDEGEVFTFDWTLKLSEDVTKVEHVTRVWGHERDYRPCHALDISPFCEDTILTVHDYHFCVWRADCNVPVFTSMNYENTWLTCGCFSPTRPGVIVIGRSDGNVDFWDLTDQSHKPIIVFQVAPKGVASLRFQRRTPYILNVGDNEGSLRVLVLPSNLSRKAAGEENTIEDFYQREVKRVEYFQNRFTIRDEESRKKKTDVDTEDTEQTKEEENPDLEEGLEREYQAFVSQYIEEVIEGKKPKEKEQPKKR